MQTLLLVLSTIFAVISPTTYIISTLKGHAKPHRMTRFILFFVLTLNFFSILASRGNTGAIVFAGITCIQATIIFWVSIWKGMGGTSKFDWVCLGIAGLGILGWKATGNPVVGVLFSVIADFAAYLPAFIKTWKYPHTESAWFYLFGILAAFLSLIAYPLQLASIFQIYIISSASIMVLFIYRTPQTRKR